MGQNRKEWQGKSHVELEQFQQELQADINEEKRLLKMEILLLFLVFSLAVLREIIYPSQLQWIIELREFVIELFT